MKKIAIIIQARLNSTRLPRKVFLELDGKRVIDHVVDTCKSVCVEGIETEVRLAVPCTDYKEFYDYARDKDIDVYYGHYENNLVERYEQAFTKECDGFIRITADCPLIPRHVIEACVGALTSYHYVTNTMQRTFPDGFDCQGISRRAWNWYRYEVPNEEHLFSTLEKHKSEEFASQGFTLNHIMSNQIAIANPYHPEAKLSLDTKEDHERIVKHIENIRRTLKSSVGSEQPGDK